jgi:hypothetical protein
MYTNTFSAFSTARKADRLICVWVPTGNPTTPLACVWLEDKHYPANCIVHSSSIEEVQNEEAGRMQPCA